MEKHKHMPKSKKELREFALLQTVIYKANGGEVTQGPTVWARGSK